MNRLKFRIPEESKKLTLYVDWASQPSRAVVAFCRINKIEHELVVIRISK